MSNLTDLTIAAAAQGLDAGKFTSEDLTLAHLDAMEEMKAIREAGEMGEWFEKKRDEFDDLPEDD